MYRVTLHTSYFTPHTSHFTFHVFTFSHRSIAWITERLGLPPALTDWVAIDHPAAIGAWRAGGSPCQACAPQMPKLEWLHVGRKVTAVEDPVQVSKKVSKEGSK